MRRMNIRHISIAAALIALNLTLGKTAATLALPVYMDTIGTILAPALLPLGPALAVAIISPLVAGLVIHPAFPAYTGTGIAISLVAAAALRLGAFKRLWTALLTGFVIALVATIVSAPVTVMVFGGVTLSGTSAVNAVLMAAGNSIWKSVITGSMLVESVDKVAACAVVWVLLKRMPERLRTTA